MCTAPKQNFDPRLGIYLVFLGHEQSDRIHLSLGLQLFQIQTIPTLRPDAVPMIYILLCSSIRPLSIEKSWIHTFSFGCSTMWKTKRMISTVKLCAIKLQILSTNKCYVTLEVNYEDTCILNILLCWFWTWKYRCINILYGWGKEIILKNKIYKIKNQNVEQLT